MAVFSDGLGITCEFKVWAQVGHNQFGRKLVSYLHLSKWTCSLDLVR